MVTNQCREERVNVQDLIPEPSGMALCIFTLKPFMNGAKSSFCPFKRIPLHSANPKLLQRDIALNLGKPAFAPFFTRPKKPWKASSTREIDQRDSATGTAANASSKHLICVKDLNWSSFEIETFAFFQASTRS
jgi:hypothetical protein